MSLLEEVYLNASAFDRVIYGIAILLLALVVFGFIEALLEGVVVALRERLDYGRRVVLANREDEIPLTQEALVAVENLRFLKKTSAGNYDLIRTTLLEGAILVDEPDADSEEVARLQREIRTALGEVVRTSLETVPEGAFVEAVRQVDELVGQFSKDEVRRAGESRPDHFGYEMD